MDAGNVSAIISAAAGLTGVLTGSLITFLKERRSERIKDEKDASYLAILVTTHLDRFANGCMHVSLDDGTAYGQPAGGSGRYRTTVAPPKFQPLDVAVEWKVLPKSLMYSILEIPAKQEHIESRLAGILEHDDNPYEQGEFFLSRQRDYAELGISVSEVVLTLRKHAELPIEVSLPGTWDRQTAMRDVIARVDSQRAAADRRFMDRMSETSAPGRKEGSEAS